MKKLDSQEQTYSKRKQGTISRKSLFTLFFLVICVMDESAPCSTIQTIITDFFYFIYMYIFVCDTILFACEIVFLLLSPKTEEKKTVEHIIWHILYFCFHIRSSSLLTIWNTVQWQSNYLTRVSL